MLKRRPVIDVGVTAWTVAFAVALWVLAGLSTVTLVQRFATVQAQAKDGAAAPEPRP